MQLHALILGPLVLALSSWLVVIKLGITEYSIWSDEYSDFRPDSFMDLFNINKLLRDPYGCEPAVLVPGEKYRTMNDAFQYTIKDVLNSRSHRRYSRATYTGSALSDCSVDAVSVRGAISSFEIVFEMTINCPLAQHPENQVLVLSLVSRVSHETGTDGIIFNTTTRPLSTILPRILKLYNSDIYLSGLSSGQIRKRVFGTLDGYATSAYFEAELKKMSEIQFNQGFIHGGSSGHLGYYKAIDFLEDDFANAVKNYIRILWSVILTDLGAESDSNVLTDDSLEGKVPPRDPRWDHKRVFKWPLDPIQPTRLNVQYRCVISKLKPLQEFLIDILVGAASTFAMVVLAGVAATQLGLFKRLPYSPDEHTPTKLERES